MGKHPHVSVVIVSFNTVELLRACLKTVFTQTIDPEVIVVDNASTDGSPEMVEREFPEATVIRNRENRGFAAANNQAFPECTGDVIVMLNSDTELREHDVLQNLSSYLAEHPEVGVVGPRLVNGHGQVQASAYWSEPTLLTILWEYTLLNRVLYRLFPTKRYPGKFLLTPPELAHPQDVADVIGACIAFRKEILVEVGQLDERFFFFLEETDFNLRVRRAGYRVRYLPEIAVLHHWGGSVDVGGKLDRRFSYLFPSLYAFLAKHRGASAVATAKLMAVTGSAMIVALAWLLSWPARAFDRLSGRHLARALHNQRTLYAPILRWHLRGAK